jgi:DNA-directed RNA polymerase specialized sigma24 family protein
MTSLTQLIQQVGSDHPAARDELFAAAYPELRKLARARLRSGGRNTMLETTALVHEAYLRFLAAGHLRLEDRRAFFAYSSRVMRSVIIDTVRERQAERILQVNDALLALEQAEPRMAVVVEMRYFGGYSDDEIAEALDLNKRTIRRDWEKARLLLFAALRA